MWSNVSNKYIGNYQLTTDPAALEWLAESGWKNEISVSGGSFGGSGRIYTEYQGRKAIVDNGQLYVSPDRYRITKIWRP